MGEVEGKGTGSRCLILERPSRPSGACSFVGLFRGGLFALSGPRRVMGTGHRERSVTCFTRRG